MKDLGCGNGFIRAVGAAYFSELCVHSNTIHGHRAAIRIVGGIGHPLDVQRQPRKSVHVNVVVRFNGPLGLVADRKRSKTLL